MITLAPARGTINPELKLYLTTVLIKKMLHYLLILNVSVLHKYTL